MKMAIVGGTGYVGLCTAVGFAAKGHEVFCVGRDKNKIEGLKKGHVPIYEPGVAEWLKRNAGSGNFVPTDSIEQAVKNSDVTFICVGTPSKKDGGIELKDVREVSRNIGGILNKIGRYHVVIVKSTVVPGTTEGTVIPELEKCSGKAAGRDFGVAMNPEFLREGKALEDFLNPDRIVIGELDKKSGDAVASLYDKFTAPIVRTDLKTAEMTKYASNAFLATKISFINEIGNMCKILGIDVYDVSAGIGLDKRIGPKFLDAGIGYGGSCFPKDVAAIIAKAKGIGYEPRLLESVENVNRGQRKRAFDLLKKRLGSLGGKKVAILGLSFKPDTDDIREAPSIDIIRMLLEEGAVVSAYDPQASGNMKAVYPDAEYAEDIASALRNADACLLLTEWDEFRRLDESDFSGMRGRLIIEGRRVLRKESFKGFSVEGICW
ncbi:MAG: UDP-glucose/GDP-mannose dehydrogenase family protein [Candidatus Aenigmarchaeota archaeon]|nr:UDP-glucose/GDP-mannose dehydrogenase family protein [Candidatus Aenigmarchaeota archaeon]